MTMWMAGASASEIARQLNNGRTRNSVLGRIHRKNLRPRAERVQKKRPLPKPPSVAMCDGAKTKKPLKPSFSDGPALEEDPGPLDPPITLLDLGVEHCRWPYVTESSYVYCGRPPKAGKPFCECHCRIGYQPEKSVTQAKQRSA